MIAELAMWQLEKYGTTVQLSFLYSCATNPVERGVICLWR